MSDITITSIDLADGLKAKNLVLPVMQIDVVLKNPPADLQKAFKDDKLILQKMAMAAFEELKQARNAFREGVEALDESYTRKPPSDEQEAQDRVKTFNTTCKQIVQSQSDAAVAAAQQEWDKQARKDKDLVKFKLALGLKMTLGSIAIAVSVTAAGPSIGTLAVTILGAAKTVAGMVADVYDFCRDMDKAEKDIISTDAALAEEWSNHDVTAGKVGKELAAALGVPFIKSVVSLQKLLAEYNSKNARKDHLADELWSRSKKLMASIEAAPATISAAQKKTLKLAGDAVTRLLDQISDLSALSRSNDLFHATYQARWETYRALEGGKLGGTAAGTGILVVLAGIASTTETIVEIATKLA